MFRIDIGSCKEWSCISCFDYEQKIGEINAENISNIIFKSKVLW